MRMKRYVILHNIRSAHNVGSIFRTSEGAGVSKIFISGYTPAPIDRFGREQKEILKTSLGATHMVPFEVVDSIEDCIQKLKEEGMSVVSVELTPHAIDYKSYVPTKDTAFIFGNETSGVEEDVLKLSDTHIEIPMSGQKESLNVSVCAGVILFHFR